MTKAENKPRLEDFWVAISTKMPRKNKTVLVWVVRPKFKGPGKPYEGWVTPGGIFYVRGVGFARAGYVVTHWMPYPGKPQNSKLFVPD